MVICTMICEQDLRKKIEILGKLFFEFSVNSIEYDEASGYTFYNQTFW